MRKYIFFLVILFLIPNVYSYLIDTSDATLKVYWKLENTSSGNDVSIVDNSTNNLAYKADGYSPITAYTCANATPIGDACISNISSGGSWDTPNPHIPDTTNEGFYVNGDVTIGAWVKNNGDAATSINLQPFITLQATDTGYSSLLTLGYRGNTDLVGCMSWNSSGNSFYVWGEAVNNTWVYYTCSYDNDTKNVSLYSDGQLVNSSVLEGDWTPVDATRIFVQSNYYGFTWRYGTGGYIDEVAVWNETKTSEEIYNIYSGTATAYLDFNITPYFYYGIGNNCSHYDNYTGWLNRLTNNSIVNGSEWIYSLDFSPGTYEWNVYCCDENLCGWINETNNYTFTFAGFYPNVTITSITNNSKYNTENFTLTWSSSTELGNIDTCWYSLDGQNNLTNTSPTILYGLIDGQHNVTIWCNESINNNVGSSGFYTFYIDTQIPTIDILFPINGTYYNNVNLSINWTSNEVINWSGYSLDGSANITINGNGTFLNYSNCYQESANVSTTCGGLDTGSYYIPGLYLYVNYTKPIGATNNSLWQVKHSNLSAYNVTLEDCWNTNNEKLIFRFYSDVQGGNGASFGECYNGSDWEIITEYELLPLSSELWNLTNSNLIIDGNWNTSASYVNFFGWVNDTKPNTAEMIAQIFEEGMWWDYEGWHNVTVSVNDSANNFNTSDFVYFFIDVTPPTFSNPWNESSEFFPEIGDTTTINITINDSLTNIDTCFLMINDNGSWFNATSSIINNNNIMINMSYTIRNISTANNSNITWAYWCNDTAGNFDVSDYYNFTVVDVTLPLITLNPSNGFSENNNTIISSGLYNLSLNVTFFDYNLFQAQINITCDINGSIYNYEMLDWNQTYLTVNTTIDLNGLDIQKCEAYLSASDDHTNEIIPRYNYIASEDGLSFNTEYNNKVEILSLDNDFNTANSIKEIDRQLFNFYYNDKKLNRTYIIKNDKDLYFREGSNYPAHFVAWNKEVSGGNWIDLDEYDIGEKHYTIEKLNNKEYKVVVSVKVPENPILEPKQKGLLGFIGLGEDMTEEELILDKYGIDEVTFRSIGGLNIENKTFYFYVGGHINFTNINLYSNTTFEECNVTLKNTDAEPTFTTKTHTYSGTGGLIENLTNGTYTLDFGSQQFFNQTYSLFLENTTQYINYSTYEGIVNVIVSSIKVGTLINNVNVSFNDSLHLGDNNTYNYTTWYMNSSNDLLLNILAINFSEYNYTFNLSYRENLTIYAQLPIAATFFLWDERTLEVFNSSGADAINFLLFCPDSTYTTVLNENVTNQTIPINCNYTKFKFILDYSTTSYYRTFIMSPNDLYNVNIYLIDKQTTQDIYNSLILDDLLQDYDNPSIYVMKIINDEQVQITADWVDIENKIGAFLIENHEYLIEIHSDNNPVRYMGTYSADISGDKTIRLYDIGLSSEPETFDSSIHYVIGPQTRGNDTYIVGLYNDSLYNTTNVTFFVYENAWNGTVLYNVSTTEQNAEFEWNASDYVNVSTLYASFEIQHTLGEKNYVILISEVNEILLDIFDYLDEGWFDWALVMFLGVIAITASIKTANIVSIALIGIASLFVIFGWFSLSGGILALASIIAIFTLLKGEDRGI